MTMQLLNSYVGVQYFTAVFYLPLCTLWSHWPAAFFSFRGPPIQGGDNTASQLDSTSIVLRLASYCHWKILVPKHLYKDVITERN